MMDTKKYEKRITQLEDALKEVRDEHRGEVTEAFPLGSICMKCTHGSKIVRWPCATYEHITKVLDTSYPSSGYAVDLPKGGW